MPCCLMKLPLSLVCNANITRGLQVKKIPLLEYIKEHTQSSLAERLGTTHQQLSRHCNHKNAIDMFVVEDGEKIALYHNKRLHGDRL